MNPAPTPAADDDEFEVLSNREKTAGRAVRATVFGLVCPPILLFAVVLLLKALFMPGRLEGRHRKHLLWVGCLAGVIILFLVLGFVVLLQGPPGFAAELRTMPHPDIMVGTWEGAYKAKNGEVHVFMRLNRNGGIEYRESGAADRKYTGGWAYDNHTFLVCYDRVDIESDPIKGRLLTYETEGIRESEMVLRIGQQSVRMVRTD